MKLLAIALLVLVPVWSGVSRADGPDLPLAITEFPPFEYAEGKEITGTDTEIVRQVLQRMGYRPVIKSMPWSRALEEARNGIVAGLFSLTKNPERERDYYFSAPLSTVRDVFFKRRDRDIAWRTMDDLKTYRIGVSHGYQYAPEFMKAVKQGKIKVNVLSGDSLELRHLGMLKSGRVDLCICEVSACTHIIRTNRPEFDMLDFIDKNIGQERYYYLAFSRKWPGARALVKRFDAELARFAAEGGRKRIFEKYGVASSLE
ncbi:substrate-binding periplasmic protein [Salidesulfovibrio onnuriiensis]|uniref:substrate-binding periplasmic protein n=1 Tax=Salidesulfovibrio onnuriiensis TaxID=2583823 RepID=UPI0011C7E16F|nr:transporter substrate-binding domain-containing protein [Salidesulfovibrio onnuriiensis]